MDTEKQTTHSPNKPLLPVWATVPLYIIASFLLMAILGGVVLSILESIPESDSIYYDMTGQFAIGVVTLGGAWICAVLFLKYIDQCPVKELGMSIKGRWKDCFAGFLYAVPIYAIGFTASLAFNVIEITSVNAQPEVLIGTLFVYFVAAAMEEVMIRGYVQGRLMTKMNRFPAMVIASLIFSLMHIFNSNIDVLPLINLFLAGLLLGASYMYTRNLWFPIFLHTAWNWIQGSVLGYEVSGTKMFPSMISLHLPEENIINGGRFGFEGSIICTILTLIATALIIVYYERKRTAKL